MNLLITHRELDTAGYDMAHRLASEYGMNVFVTYHTLAQQQRIVRPVEALWIPEIRRKVEWGVIRCLRTHVQRHAIDVVFSPGSSGLSNALMATLGTRARNVGYRGTQARIRRTDPTYYLGVLNPRVRHIVCETDDIQTYLSHFVPARKLSVCLKPFDVKWVADACRQPMRLENLPADAITCVYIGSCKGRPFKGLGLLVRAFHMLTDERLHLIFVGDYDESDAALANQGPAAKRIHFVGYRPDAIAWLPAADVFVLPSLRDASPRVVREAMACGLPCVVSNIPGARDLLEKGRTGLLFRSGDAADLADKLMLLANDADLRTAMGRAGRERIERHFNVQTYAARFNELFVSLVSGGRGSQQ